MEKEKEGRVIYYYYYYLLFDVDPKYKNNYKKHNKPENTTKSSTQYTSYILAIM